MYLLSILGVVAAPQADGSGSDCVLFQNRVTAGQLVQCTRFASLIQIEFRGCSEHILGGKAAELLVGWL